MRNDRGIFTADIESTINHESYRILSECYDNIVAPRGLQVAEALLQELRFHPYFCIQDFECRPFNWKYFAGELYWYLSGECTTDIIDKYSKFWNKLVSEDGTVNSNYGHLLFSDQLRWVISKLREDPYTRQAIAIVNRPIFQYEGVKDFPCTMYLNFFIRDDVGGSGRPTLFMKVTMRSNDIFYGLCYDAPFFSSLMQTVYLNIKGDTDLALGTYIHYADNIHYYMDNFQSIADRILVEGEPKGRIHALILREPLLTLENDVIVTSPGATAFMKAMKSIEGNGNNSDYLKILSSIYDIKEDLYTEISNQYKN